MGQQLAEIRQRKPTESDEKRCLVAYQSISQAFKRAHRGTHCDRDECHRRSLLHRPLQSHFERRHRQDAAPCAGEAKNSPDQHT